MAVEEVDPVRWPHTSTALHFINLALVAQARQQGILAKAAHAALDRAECRLMGGQTCA